MDIVKATVVIVGFLCLIFYAIHETLWLIKVNKKAQKMKKTNG